MNLKSKIGLSSIINLFFAFTLIVYGPYEIFIGNANDFSFSFGNIWWILALAAVLYVLVASAIFSLVPPRVCVIFNMLVFSFTICCYIQAMFFNSQLATFNGEAIVWSTGTKTWNFIIWIVLFLAFFLLPFYLKDKWKTIVMFIASALIVMQLVALCSLLFTSDSVKESKQGCLLSENMLELSKDNNVVVFLVDMFDTKYMDQIVDENPTFLDPLDGFTYFTDAISMYSRTYPSIPYLLTGKMCYLDKPYRTWVEEASKESDFLPTLGRNGIDVGVYTSMAYLGETTRQIIKDYQYKYIVDVFGVLKSSAKMILYRDLPYLFKKRFEYDSPQINYHVTNDIHNGYTCQDDWFREKLTTKKVNVSDGLGSFRFYHLQGPHKDLSIATKCGMQSFEIIYEYIRQMKELGIYDKSTILIISDHGLYAGGDSESLPQKTGASICFVKPAGSSGTKLSVSQAPISHTEFIPTVLAAYSLQHEGKTMFEIEENESRQRKYYYSNQDKEYGETKLREYLVDGNARSESSYHFTGNYWDIRYSIYKVAD